MSEVNGLTTRMESDDIQATEASSNDKGKGKAADPTQDVSMGEDEDEDEDTSEDEVDEVSFVNDYSRHFFS